LKQSAQTERAHRLVDLLYLPFAEGAGGFLGLMDDDFRIFGVIELSQGSAGFVKGAIKDSKSG
jgi:hypothetical protein